MAAAATLFLTLWTSSVLSAGFSCPEFCACSDKYDHHLAECSFKGLVKVPDGFTSSVTTLSLSANKISVIPAGSFDDVTGVTSLWLAHNEIISIGQGTLAPLIHLRHLDVSHNNIVDFPWEDLHELTALQLLKMNNNNMVNVPRDAFTNLKKLRSLQLNNNRFVTIAEGTFDGLVSLSHLQIYNNPFECMCPLDWLRDWISMTTISVPEKSLITCAYPERLKGEMIEDLPESECTSPNVTIRIEQDIQDTCLYEGGELVLTCDFIGNPKPLVVWNINSRSRNQELALEFTHDDSEDPNEHSSTSHNSVKVFNNGTLFISNLQREDSGKYSCSATNELGRGEDSVLVMVLASLKPTPSTEITTSPTHMQVNPFKHQTTDRLSVLDLVHHPNLKRKDITTTLTTHHPTTEHQLNSEAMEFPPIASKCSTTANTRYITSHILNGSPHDIKKYTFDFGVIALGVSETEATVRLNPLLIPRDKSTSQDDEDDSSSESEERRDLLDFSQSVNSNGLYLCVTADRKHAAVQWSRIKEGVNTYMFSGLRPGTNYSLCLTYKVKDCEVQVLFSTRRRVPNLFIIVSVSICLLTVSTVPLLCATCFHLVYKYRSKTYKLILKAKDQYHINGSLAANFNSHAPHTESHKKINGSQLDEEEGETESPDGDKEPDTEETMVTESFSLAQCRRSPDDCEAGPEYDDCEAGPEYDDCEAGPEYDDCEAGPECSDWLPLGAEAVNITCNDKYSNQ